MTSAHQALEPFQGEHQVSAALVARDRVQFVDDNEPHGAQLLAETRRRQQDEQRLRRCNQYLRRTPQHRRPLTRRGITSAKSGADCCEIKAIVSGDRTYPGKRLFEIDSYVV